MSSSPTKRPKVGQKIYGLVPPDHHANEQIREYTVTKVGTKFVSVEYEHLGQAYSLGDRIELGRGYPWRLPFNTWLPRIPIFFETRAETEEYQETLKLKREILAWDRQGSLVWAERLLPEQVRAIHIILFPPATDG